ncbi:MAG: hypothetical protein B7Y45_02705 [Sphingomonas sp. 28-66-16]|nr:MAG: hypothetical protein B7Y45_02705 [Sphingomonas sp. 28-66-16]
MLVACDRATSVAEALPRHPENIKAADRINIVGWVYPSSKPRGIILLFHQAGSSKNEYDTIGPRLAADGFTAFAIDQRAGGDLFGDNSTVHLLDGSKPYLEAKQDLQAAVDWANKQTPHLPVLIWGSSYSAALVFLVAAENKGKVQGVLAFSPGEYLGAPDLVERAAAQVRVPIFATAAKDAGEIGAARAIVEAAPAATKQLYVPPTAGVHGSSTLIAARNPRGAEENWRAVEQFLRRIVPVPTSPKNQ